MESVFVMICVGGAHCLPDDGDEYWRNGPASSESFNETFEINCGFNN